MLRKPILQSRLKSLRGALLTVLAFTVVGVAATIAIRAAIEDEIVIEVGEGSAITSPAVVVADTSASKGSAVRFSSAGGQPLLQDDFSSFPLGTCYGDGSAFGQWTSAFASHGCTTVVAQGEAGNKVLQLAPQASTSAGETHSSLVLSPQTSGPLKVTLDMRTVKQLRTPTPNPWETAWVFWNYTREGSFYYFALKTNGWELGKSDNTKANLTGPDCLFPSYQNCKYPGAQRFLADARSPTFPRGPWHTVVITQTNNNTITATVDGAPIVTFTDTDAPLTSGKVGLYNEDAQVQFDNVLIERP